MLIFLGYFYGCWGWVYEGTFIEGCQCITCDGNKGECARKWKLGWWFWHCRNLRRWKWEWSLWEEKGLKVIHLVPPAPPLTKLHSEDGMCFWLFQDLINMVENSLFRAENNGGWLHIAQKGCHWESIMSHTSDHKLHKKGCHSQKSDQIRSSTFIIIPPSPWWSSSPPACWSKWWYTIHAGDSSGGWT